MDENIGIFRVISVCNGKKEILGTAFAIKTLFEEKNKYYLLTAYHVISESEAKGHRIIVEDENGNAYSALRVFPQRLSGEYREFGQDYALLEIYSNIMYRGYEITVSNRTSDCLVRGAVPHYSTVFTSIDGKVLGEEKIYGQKKVLQLRLNTSLIFNDQNEFIPQQTILRGLSGAPVLVEMEDETVCVGVLGNLERDRRGSAQYAVPLKTIIQDCLERLHIRYRIFGGKEKEYPIYQNKAFIELTIGNTENFVFSEEELEQQAWNKLSDLFYTGIPADRLLGGIIGSDIILGYNPEVQCALMYFYARLLFKRNNSARAFAVFSDISGMLRKVSRNTKNKLEALISCRRAIEKKIITPGETLKAIRYAGDKVASLPNSTDTYIAYELASMFGRGLTNLFSVDTDFSCQEKEEIFKIYTEHSRLLEKNPVKLCKQDVVNTSLQWYIGFWQMNKEFDLQSLSTAVRKGFCQSKKRRNGIFYIQSMISYGIVCILNHEITKAAKILLLSVKLILKEKIQLNHEGVKQLLLLLKEKYISMYAVVELAYRTQMDYAFYDKVSLYEVGMGISWESMVAEVNEFYIINFGGNNVIYDVGIEDIEILL